ncbi:MAG: CBS domain-containing protein [Candidatus Nitrosotenuis sp.]|nr:CBS domain-containing protein [Candidatus Nitrosotenuis sp.]
MSDKMFSSPVFTLQAQQTIKDALVMMQTNFIKRIIIVNEKKPIGVVTERDINKFLENDKTRRALNEIPLREIMKRNLITITKGQTDHLEQCATRMITFKIGSIVVVDDDGNLAGITTQTDITRAFYDQYPGKYKVRDYMTVKAITCRDSDSLYFALELINKNEVSRLIVTDNMGRIKGVVTTNTFLTHSDYFKKSGKTRSYLLAEQQNNHVVSDLIGKEILTVEPDDDLATAARIMIENKISGIPVTNVQDVKIMGVVSKFDVVRAYSNVVPHAKLLEKYKTFR